MLLVQTNGSAVSNTRPAPVKTKTMIEAAGQAGAPQIRPASQETSIPVLGDGILSQLAREGGDR